MVKLSQQLERKRQTRETRTQRVAQQQEFEKDARQQEFEKQKRLSAIETISQADYENYEEKYKSIDSEYRGGIMSPSELKATEGYKTYQEEKKQKEVIATWQSSFDAYGRRNKPFVLGLDPSKEAVRRFNEVKKAMAGKQSSVPSYVVSALRGGVPTDFGVPQRVYGVDVGEKIKITTKVKGTEEIKKHEEFYRDPETRQLTYGKITGKEIEELKQEELKKARDKAYKEWQEKQAPVEEKSIVTPVIDDRKWYEKSMEELFISKGREKLKSGASFVVKGAKKVYGKIPSGTFYYNPPKISPFGVNVGTFSISPKSERSIDASAIVEEMQKDLGKVSGDVLSWAVGKDRIEKLDLEMQEEYQSKYQSAFESKYMKSLIYEEKTFEQASKEFETSAGAQKIQKDFQEEYGEEYADLSRSTSLGKKLAGGSAIVGLSFTQLGLSAIKTPKSAVLTAGLVYTGAGVLKTIPTHVGVTTSVGLGAYGGYKAFSPTSTVEEAGSGIVTAVLSGATLSYAGYRYLRSPVIKTVKIKSPRASLKSSEVKGYDVKLLTDQKAINKVAFQSQKLSQTGMAGRRTVLSTKVRSYLKLDPIYKGVPTQQLGRTVTLRNLGGSYTYKTSSAYQKAFGKLTKYGYTPSQARGTLRYTAPKVTEQYLGKGTLTLKGSKAFGEFEYLTKKPVIDVDKSLGIKTRGGRTIKDIYSIERKLTTIKGHDIVLEKGGKISLILDKGKVVDAKGISFKRGFSVGKASPLRKGYDVTKFEKVYAEVKYKDLYGVSVSRDILPTSKVINIDASRTRLISKVIDAQTKQYGFKPTGVKKTPLSKTFGSQQKVMEIKEIIKTPSATGSQVNKIVNKIDTQQLKTAITPDVKQLTAVKSFIKIKQIDPFGKSKFAVKIGSALSTKVLLDLKTDLKTDVKLKTDLKSMINLKDIMKEDVILKTKQSPILKQAPVLKQQTALKQSIANLTGVSLKTPTYNIPKIKPPVTPTIPIPLWLKTAIGKKIGKKKKGEFEEFALLPDFTSRAIGINPEIMTGKQAQIRIKKILTGLEVRRGVVIK